MSIGKRKGSPFWWYDFTVQGERLRGSCETDDKETAKAVEARERTKAILGDRRKPRLTLDEACAKYWESRGQNCASAFTSIKHTCDNMIDAFGGNTYLDQIGDFELDKYVTICQKKIANGTINRRLDVLSAIYTTARKKWGVDAGELDISKHRLIPPEARTRWITPEEADKLILAAATHLKPCIRFALLTTNRLSNIVGLKWEDVDLHNRIIKMRVKSIRPGRKVHEIPITNAMLILLIEQEPKKEGHVFVRRFKPDKKTKKEKMPVPIKKFRTSFKNACIKAEIKDFRFHDLRHTAASWMRQNGVPIEDVKDVMGHSDIRMTLKYAHSDKQAKRSAMEKLAAAQIRHTNKRSKKWPKTTI